MSDDPQTKRARMPHDASPWMFFLLLFGLSLPFYVLGAEGERLPVATFLPMSALMAFIPMIAALVLVWRESGAKGAKDFVGRAFDYRRIKGAGWVVAALVLMPAVFILEYGVHRLSGAGMLGPSVSIAMALAFFLMFFVGAIGEELGWQGYAFPGLREKRGALGASLVLGAIWALWHVIPYFQMGRSIDWIVWHGLGMVALRVIIVWLFVNTGQSVFVAALFHAMTNMAWGLFPNYGSAYDPIVMFVILAVLAGSVVVLWGPSTLARFRSRGRA